MPVFGTPVMYLYHSRVMFWLLRGNTPGNKMVDILAIAAWSAAVYAGTDDKYGDVHMHQFYDYSQIVTSLNQLADEHSVGAQSPEIISQEELIRR